jgi:hypothetical protein
VLQLERLDEVADRYVYIAVALGLRVLADAECRFQLGCIIRADLGALLLLALGCGLVIPTTSAATATLTAALAWLALSLLGTPSPFKALPMRTPRPRPTPKLLLSAWAEVAFHPTTIQMQQQKKLVLPRNWLENMHASAIG